MNSDNNRGKEKKKKKKMKKSKGEKGEIPNEVQVVMKKNALLSKLDALDDIMKEESRVVEEKLKSGLIKSEQAEKKEIIERKTLIVIEIKKEIDNLQNIKNKYHSEGNYEKVIKISKKIIVLAFSNNLKSVVNEEKRFLDIIRKKVIQEPEGLDIRKDIVSTVTPEVDLVGKYIINEEIIERDLNQKVEEKVEKERRDLEKEKLKFKEEKDRFEQEILQFEEKEEKLKQERIRFEKEKEAFKWEKQMFEEIKKHEKERSNDLNKT